MSDAVRLALANARTIAVVGASANPARPSHGVLRYLVGAGYDCVAINPGHAGGTILDRPCYARLADVPGVIDMVDVFRRSEAIPAIVGDMLTLDPLPKTLWLQLDIRHAGAEARARAAGVAVIADRCTAVEHRRLAA